MEPCRQWKTRGGAIRDRREFILSAFWSSNDLLRGADQGTMALIPSGGINVSGYSAFPALLNASLKQLTVEKLPSQAGFDLAVRDAKTGFTFFNVEASQYDYDAKAQLLRITGRLRLSKPFAKALVVRHTRTWLLERSPSPRQCNRSRSHISMRTAM